MNRMLKKWRSVTALLLAMSMVLGMSGIAYASNTKSAEEPKKKYVSLGDSMANGYGLDGYQPTENENVNGFLMETPSAYPTQVANEMGWDLSAQLATSAMRVEDLRFILEYDYENDKAGEYAGDRYTEDEFVNNRFNDWADSELSGMENAKYAGTKAVAEKFQTEVANADVISMGIGNANFGVFMLYRLMDILGVMSDGDLSDVEWIEFEDSLAELEKVSPEAKEVVMNIYNETVKILKEEVTPSPKVDMLADLVGYTVVSYMLNYNAVLNDIVKMNPDAEIILVGLMNTMSGLVVNYEHEGTVYALPVGRAMDYAISTMNLYLAALPATYQLAENEAFADATLYFAEARNVDMLVSEYKVVANEGWEGNKTLRDRLITEVCEKTVFPMVKDMFNDLVKDYNLALDTGITRADVEAYEAYDANPEGETTLSDNKVFTCAIYLAFEEAIISACQTNVIDASSFIKLYSGLGDVFAGVADALSPEAIGLGEEEIAELMNTVTSAVAKDYAEWCKGDTVAAEISSYAQSEEGKAAIEAYKNENSGASDNDAAAACYMNTTAGANKVNELKAKYIPYYASRAIASGITAPLADALKDDMLTGLFNLFGRMLVGDGIGTHPSAKGHDTLTAAIVNAYKNGNTVDVETVEKLEAAFAKIQKWIELYGEDALRYGYEWAEENGYIDQLKNAVAELKAEIKAYAEEAIPAIKAELKALKAELEDLKAQLENASAELKAEIEAKIAEIEAKIAELEAKLAEIEAKVKEVIAAVEGLEDAINNFVELIKKGAIESVNAAIEEIQKALDNIANAISNVEDLVNAINKAIDEVQAFAEEVVEGIKALKAEVEAKVEEAIKDVEAALEQAEALANQIAAEAEKAFAEIEAKVNEVIAAAEAVYADATTAEYEVSADSYYVALGDAAASDYYADPASYASLVAEELGIDSVNLAESGLSVPALLEALEDDEVASEIAAADLITVGFNATGILEAAFTVEKTDWAAYVGEEGAAYIEAAVAEAAAAFTEAGLPAELVSIVEAFPYALVEYMANFHKVAGEIHEINEDALVILVGMYNPLEGLSANIDGEEVALGDFVDGLIEVSNLHMTACAMLEENTIFVEAPAVETWFEQDGGDVTAAVEYIMALLDGDGYLYPSDLGHEYIKEQILGALTITEDEIGVLGDVNNDGVINMKDVTLLYQHVQGIKTIDAAAQARGNVFADDIVNMKDVTRLYQYVQGIVTEF